MGMGPFPYTQPIQSWVHLLVHDIDVEEEAHTHQCTIHWMPVITEELIFCFTLVTNPVRNRSQI
jgi:hypothetical protein